jgi:hypothetical protein
MHVVFVAPTLSPNTLQCLRALLDLPGVRLGLITHVEAERLPGWLRAGVGGHYQVGNALDPDQLTPAVRAFQSAAPVDRLLGFLEHVQIPLAITRDRTGVPGMSEAVAHHFRDKNRMKAVLREAGLPVARQAIVRGVEDLERFVSRAGLPIVLKPIAGVGSKATRRVSTGDELRRAVEELGISATHPMQAEEFVVGAERSFETAMIHGRAVWSSTTHYMDRPLEILETPWRQWCVVLPREPMDAVAAAFEPINQAALRVLGMTDGLAHMEWFVRPDGSPVISEVGARPPGASFMTMLSVAHGVDVWAKWVELVTYGRWQVPPRVQAVGCAYLRGTGDGRRIHAVHGLDEAQRRVGPLVVDRQLPVVGAARSDSYEGDGWVIVAHPTTAGVRDALLSVVTTVRVEYA